jgi:hypothetical protein
VRAVILVALVVIQALVVLAELMEAAQYLAVQVVDCMAAVLAV